VTQSRPSVGDPLFQVTSVTSTASAVPSGGVALWHRRHLYAGLWRLQRAYGKILKARKARSSPANRNEESSARNKLHFSSFAKTRNVVESSFRLGRKALCKVYVFVMTSAVFTESLVKSHDDNLTVREIRDC
jgi:hypothetical protein